MQRSYRLRSSYESAGPRPPPCARAAGRRSLPRLVGLRRHLAVRRIDDEPRAAVLRRVILEPVQRAPQFAPLPSASTRASLRWSLRSAFDWR